MSGFQELSLATLRWVQVTTGLPACRHLRRRQPTSRSPPKQPPWWLQLMWPAQQTPAWRGPGPGPGPGLPVLPPFLALGRGQLAFLPDLEQGQTARPSSTSRAAAARPQRESSLRMPGRGSRGGWGTRRVAAGRGRSPCWRPCLGTAPWKEAAAAAAAAAGLKWVRRSFAFRLGGGGIKGVPAACMARRRHSSGGGAGSISPCGTSMARR
jgi:hypothetical protein